MLLFFRTLMFAWFSWVAKVVVAEHSEMLQSQDQFLEKIGAQYSLCNFGYKLYTGKLSCNGLLRRNAAGERIAKDIPVLTIDEVVRRVKEFRDLTKMYQRTYKHHKPPSGNPNDLPYRQTMLDILKTTPKINQHYASLELELKRKTIEKIQRLRAANLGWRADALQKAMEEWWIAANTKMDAIMGLSMRESEKRQRAQDRPGSDSSLRSAGSPDLFDSSRSDDSPRSGVKSRLGNSPKSDGGPKIGECSGRSGHGSSREKGSGCGSVLEKAFLPSRPS